MEKALEKPIFRSYLLDSTKYSLQTFTNKFVNGDFVGGFLRYEKYRRIDVVRILKWGSEPVMQNVAGYKTSDDRSNCPIFVTYNKAEDVTDTTNYEDEFISQQVFSHISKSRRTINSPEILLWTNQKNNKIRLPLFIKKSDDEGDEHYFIGDLYYIEGSANETAMSVEGQSSVSAVNCRYNLDKAVEESLYKYLLT